MKKRVLALAMASVMAISLAACGGSGKPSGETTTTEAAQGTTTEAATEAASGSGANFVYATSTFGQKFSPFFYTTTYDGEVVQMVHASLLASDRGGAIVEKGIEGETRDYNGTDYTYYGLGDVEVVQNDDGTVDYKLMVRRQRSMTLSSASMFWQILLMMDPQQSMHFPSRVWKLTEAVCSPVSS